MGGNRSGRHSGAPVIEHGLKIDLRWLRKRRLFRPGFWNDWTTLSWSSGARIDVRCFDGSNAEVPLCHLRYWVDGQRIEEAIRLERFPQPFGGHRWYFICPATGKRCQCLYLPPGGGTRFRCRTAFSSRLLYLSQTLSPQGRYQEQARRISRKVFEAWPEEWRRENEDKWEFPPKPKWMRWKTYKRLDERASAYESAADGLAVYRLLRLAGRISRAR